MKSGHHVSRWISSPIGSRTLGMGLHSLINSLPEMLFPPLLRKHLLQSNKAAVGQNLVPSQPALPRVT